MTQKTSKPPIPAKAGGDAESTAAEPSAKKAKRIGFLAALAGVLVLVEIGHLALICASDHWRVFQQLRESYSVFDALVRLPAATADANWIHTSILVRDVIFVAFTACFGVFAWLSRDSLVRFFRSMTVGVSIVLLSTLAVVSGVLVPQIDPPDDATVRVGAPGAPGRNYEEHYESFQWAVSYFVYHLGHLYGAGMPKTEIPPGAAAALDEFGLRYGREESENRRKGMEAAFSGQDKTDEIYAFAQRNDGALRRAFDIATRLHLNRIYRSYWFASLMTVLAIGISFNTFYGGPKRWFKPQKFGFFVVHIGMLTLLLGGALSRTYTVRGICNLHLDGLDRHRDGEYQRERGDMPPVEDAFYRSYQIGAEHLRYLPFGLSLERFARRDWPAVRLTFLDERGVPLPFKSTLPIYTLWNGRTIDLDFVETEEGSEPQLRLEVRELHERATVAGVVSRERTAAERGDSPPQAAAQLRVPDLRRVSEADAVGTLPTRTDFLRAAPPGQEVVDCISDVSSNYRLMAVREGDPRARFPQREGLLGRCFVRSLVDGAPTMERVDVRLGEMTELPGGYRVVFQRATKWYQLDPRTGAEIEFGVPLAQQYPFFPAVFAHLIAPDGTTEDRVVMDGVDPIERGLASSYTFEDLLLVLEWDEWAAPGPERFVLTWDDDGRASLASEHGAPQEVELGQPLPFEKGMRVVLEGVFDDLAYEPDIRFRDTPPREDGWEEDFYSTDPRGVELDVIAWPERPDQRVVTTVSMATTREFGAGIHVAEDRSYAIEFIENAAGFPFEWRSVLRVHERDEQGNWVLADLGSSRQREIRVNDYFFHRGYRMFQTNADSATPGYSGIGIVYDPGIPLSMAGMYIVIAGAAFAFLVRPILLARRRGNPTPVAARLS